MPTCNASSAPSAGAERHRIDLRSASTTAPSAQEATLEEHAPVPALSLRCTGSQAPPWLAESGLPVDGDGRVLTQSTLEVIGHAGLFAAGDCAVINHDPRPPSGVWAVRAAKPLARNLEASSRNQPLHQWRLVPCNYQIPPVNALRLGP